MQQNHRRVASARRAHRQSSGAAVLAGAGMPGAHRRRGRMPHPPRRSQGSTREADSRAAVHGSRRASADTRPVSVPGRQCTTGGHGCAGATGDGWRLGLLDHGRRTLPDVLTLLDRVRHHLFERGKSQPQLLKLDQQFTALLDRHAHRRLSHASSFFTGRVCWPRHTHRRRQDQLHPQEHPASVQPQRHPPSPPHPQPHRHAVPSLPLSASLTAFWVVAGPQQPQPHVACS